MRSAVTPTAPTAAADSRVTLIVSRRPPCPTTTTTATAHRFGERLFEFAESDGPIAIDIHFREKLFDGARGLCVWWEGCECVCVCVCVCEWRRAEEERRG